MTPTSRPLLLNRSPSAGFDEPFAMLEACHERVRRMLALLERLRQHLQVQGADAQAADAARDVMRYFDQAGPAHHEDEERHVLPRLRALGHAALADRLHTEHRWMGDHWRGVRAGLQAVAEQRWTAAEALGAARRWPAFAALYVAHLGIEDEQAYPLAAAAIDAPARAVMGQEMAARRGVGA